MAAFSSTKLIVLASITFTLWPMIGQAEGVGKDLGFRFQWDATGHTGRCLNADGKEGYNPHFVGACGDLRGLNLSNNDLNGMDLSGSNLDGVSLRGTMLNGANMKGVRATGADFSKADLNGADFDGAVVSGTLFNRARMNGANFYGANLSGSKIKESQLHGIHLQSTNLGGAVIESGMATANVQAATFTIGTVMPFEVADAEKRGMKRTQVESAVATKAPNKESDAKKEERQPANTPR